VFPGESGKSIWKSECSSLCKRGQTNTTTPRAVKGRGADLTLPTPDPSREPEGPLVPSSLSLDYLHKACDLPRTF